MVAGVHKAMDGPSPGPWPALMMAPPGAVIHVRMFSKQALARQPFLNVHLWFYVCLAADLHFMSTPASGTPRKQGWIDQ